MPGSWFDAAPAGDASDTVAGIIELATTAEVNTGTDATKAVTPAALAASALATDTRYQQINFTSSGSFSKASYSWAKSYKVTCIGGGGAGGGAPETGAGEAAMGGGGGAGGVAYDHGLVSAFGSSETVTIGAAGASTNTTNGGAGGTTSFGSKAVSGGGTGGLARAASATPHAAQPGVGGSGTAGDLQLSGGSGNVGFITDNELGFSGKGGDGPFGAGGRSRVTTGAQELSGYAATGYGAGGSGNIRNASKTGTLSSGAGSPGLVIVELYG
jgi:hypothetical protein